jgi:hypothetical protein
MKVAAKVASRTASKVASRKAPKLVSRKASKVASRKSLKVGSRKASKVLGTTSDEVRILKPKSPATHFTARELEVAISKARTARSMR